jgi:hypothetical protein
MTMKKIIIASLLVVLGATSSFAAATSAIVFTVSATGGPGRSVIAGKTAATTDLKPIGKLSTGVSLAFNTLTTGYALITQHQNGVKAFGTAHDSTAITYETVTKGALTGAPSAAGSAGVSGTGWTIM